MNRIIIIIMLLIAFIMATLPMPLFGAEEIGPAKVSIIDLWWFTRGALDWWEYMLFHNGGFSGGGGAAAGGGESGAG